MTLAGEPTSVCPPPGLMHPSELQMHSGQKSEDPAFVVISDTEFGLAESCSLLSVAQVARPLLGECRSCSEKVMTISQLTQQLTQANWRIAELQIQLQEAQQKLLLNITGESLKQQRQLWEKFHVDADAPKGQFHYFAEEEYRVIATSSSRGCDTATAPGATNSSPSTIAATPMSCTVNVPELIRFAERGEEGAVLTLLNAGKNPNDTDDMGLTALHCAAKKGHRKVVDLLLSRQADPNACSSAWRGETPLHYACKYGRPEVVHALLENRSDPDVRSHEDKTPLQYARDKKHRSIEDALLQAVRARAAAPKCYSV